LTFFLVKLIWQGARERKEVKEGVRGSRRIQAMSWAKKQNTKKEKTK
jgi:hypothetical protein